MSESIEEKKEKCFVIMPISDQGGKHLRKISDRTALQLADNAEEFITTRKIDSFERTKRREEEI